MIAPHFHISALMAVTGVAGTLCVYAMTFTPIDLPTTIIAVGLLVTAVSTSITAWRAARIAAVERKVDTVGQKVDGAASAQVAKVEGLQNEISMLRELLAEKKETASLLAQAKTSVDIATAVPASPKSSE